MTVASLAIDFGESKRPTAEATWKAWGPSLLQSGWKVVGQKEFLIHTLARKEGGVESMLEVALGDFDEPKLTLIELGGQATKLTFPPPAPAPKIEKPAATQDWPYLPPFPGAKLTATAVTRDAFTVILPGAEELTEVAPGTVRKEYRPRVGDDAYNLKLSGQRAETVRDWLAAHGIAAARLTAKGYGKTLPLASNDSDAGRARNRRVDLTCRK